MVRNVLQGLPGFEIPRAVPMFAPALNGAARILL